jgi:hypothetical protein
MLQRTACCPRCAEGAKAISGPQHLTQLAADLNDRPQTQALVRMAQRLSAPVQRQPVVQRVLEITDANKYFTDKESAASFLTEQYLAALKESDPKITEPIIGIAEQERLDEVAAAADDMRMVYPVPTLNEALSYITSGTPIKGMPYDLDPQQTPQRTTDDAKPWDFVLYKDMKPSEDIEIPQTPKWEGMFPNEMIESNETFNLREDIEGVSKSIGDWKEEIHNKGIGKNQYAYKLNITYRLEKLSKYEDIMGKQSFRPTKRSKLSRSSKDSLFYTSKKTTAPQTEGGDTFDVEDRMRKGLTRMVTDFDRGEFSKTSLFTKDDEGDVKKSGDYFGTATNSQLGSLYYHSEVQAVSDEDGAAAVAREAVDKMISDALEAKEDGPYSLVVVAGTITGYSDNRTVCGNACKPALARLSELVEQAMNEQIILQKTAEPVQKNGLYIRHSGQFRVSAHVGAGTRFQGLGTGAKIGVGMPTLTHHSVFEYDPNAK